MRDTRAEGRIDGVSSSAALCSMGAADGRVLPNDDGVPEYGRSELEGGVLANPIARIPMPLAAAGRWGLETGACAIDPLSAASLGS
jgi:hypothetical protein